MRGRGLGNDGPKCDAFHVNSTDIEFLNLSGAFLSEEVVHFGLDEYPISANACLANEQNLDAMAQ